jgi:hypothetical protein
VRRTLLGEGACLAVVGSVLGVGGGILYARVVLWGLANVWQGAVGNAAIRYGASTGSLVIGGAASVVVALAAMWLALRRQAGQPARVLLAGAGGGGESPVPAAGRSRGVWIAAICFCGAVALVAAGMAASERSRAGIFFGSGALLLTGGLAACHALFVGLARAHEAARMTLASLGVRNTTRRRGRSLAAAALLACGSFLVIAVGANRLDAFKDAGERSSGTGGFALFGDTTVPIFQDLNDPEGQKKYGLEPEKLGGVGFVGLRVREGDDASCLNLNRAQRPRLIGVEPAAFQSRGAFTFLAAAEGYSREDRWSILERRGEDGTVPAIGDEATVTWGLGKAVGDTIEYEDGAGNRFMIRIAAVIARSVFQGSLLVAENEFIARFPRESGYRMLLVDVEGDRDRAGAVGATLSRALQDEGLALIPAADRLSSFNVVQNTYLLIFQALGGLGLLLGSIGLGVVVLRNVLERRGELALLRAVGFRTRALRRLVLYEHWAIVALGVVCGGVSALVAVLPALGVPGSGVHYVSLGLTIAGVAASAVLWTVAATAWALRGPILEALRNE